jgi:hypothetical protein
VEAGHPAGQIAVLGLWSDLPNKSAASPRIYVPAAGPSIRETPTPQAAPSSIATSKSWLMPMERSEPRRSDWARAWSRSARNRRK